jgi:CHAT domain-containing protein/Tfp pilus assembly protein PilF
MVQRLKTAVTQKQRWLRLVPLISLSGITCLLLGSQSFATIPRQMAPRIAQQPVNSDAAKPVFLELGKPIEREISGDENHQYQITLQAGQYLHVVVEQRGIDVMVTLFDPKGQQLSVSDSPNDFQGPEPVSVVADVSGNYRLEVRQLEQGTTNSGRYEVTVKELQTATEQHRRLVAAERAFMEANQLHLQDTEEPRRQAIAKWQEALLVYQEVGDRTTVAFILSLIGHVYDILEEHQKALEFYNQALPLARAVGDRRREAKTLTGIGSVYDDLGEKQKALEFYNQALPLARAVGDRVGEATTLHNIGYVYSSLKEHQKTLEFYNQALPLYRAVGDRGGEATTLHNIGSVYSSLKEHQKALEFYTQALPLRRAVRDRGGEATTLHNIGSVYSSLKEHQKALEFYNQALPLYRAVGDRGGEASTLNNIGNVYSSLKEHQKALEFYNQALPLRRAVGDRGGEATTLHNIGLVHDNLGEHQKALEFYNQALPLRRAVGDRGGEATTLNNIGLVHDNLGEHQKALEFYNQALPLSRAVGDRVQEATTLNNIGNVYDDLGEKQKALEFHNQALPLRRAVGDRGGEAASLNNIGYVYDGLEEKQKALEYYNQSLPLSRAVGDRGQEAITLLHIGNVYSDLGEKQKALEFYSQALPLSRSVGDRGEEAASLNNIGNVYSDLGEHQKALEFYNQALPLYRAVGDREGEATNLSNIGWLYVELGNQQKALDYFKQSLLLRRQVGDKKGEAISLGSIGWVYFNRGEFPTALNYLNQSLPLSRQVGDKSSEAATLYYLATVKRKQSNLTEALTDIKAAIEIVENLRTKISSQELRASYFATVQNNYELYIDLLMQLHQQNPNQGYDALALQVSERARARSLLELLTEAKADIRQGVEPTLLERERSLQQQLSAKEESRLKLGNSPDTKEEQAAINKEIETLLDQYRAIQTEIRQKSPRYAALTQPQPFTLPQIQQQVLDDNTLLLQYSLGDERSYLWAVSKTGMTSYELPPRAEIEKTARQFYDLLTIPSERINTSKPAAAIALSQILLQPVAQQLGNKRLLIVGNGILNYIPFAALPLPQVSEEEIQPLIVAHEIITLPSASTLAILRQDLAQRTPAPKTLAILADPVFNDKDERLKNPTARIEPQPQQIPSAAINSNENPTDIPDLRDASSFNRLPATLEEAKQILALVPASESLSKLGFDANRQVVESGVLAQYRIVHFATHGQLNDKRPELSGILLSSVNEQGQSQLGFLSTSDIFNLKLEADLVVLSACNTGLGKEIKGEGLSGLTRGFMYAGASRVVASLWNVEDQATSELMTRFYQAMMEQKLSPSAALRSAQLSMWKENPRWDSFFNWAAFTIQGHWK